MHPLKIGAFLLLAFATTVSAESLKDYKKQKHRPLQKTPTGEVVTKRCDEAYIETCQKGCSDEACRAKCRADAVPYCQYRERERSKAEGELILKGLLLVLGPLITLIDEPRFFASSPDDYDPYRLIWNFPSYNADLGLGYLQGGTYSGSFSGNFRYGHFGLGANVAYLNQGGDTLGEFDLGPAFYLGSRRIASAIVPSLIGSAGSGIEPEYGFGVRTHTTFYMDQVYAIFTPLLGKINDQWLFQLRVGLGYRFSPNWALHLAYEHRSVVDLETLVISSASLNGGFVYLSFRVN